MRLFAPLAMFSFMFGILGTDELAEPGLRVVRTERSAVLIRFKAPGDWTLEWTGGGLVNWLPYSTGAAGEQSLYVPIVHEQAFFRLDVGSVPVFCGDKDGKDKHKQPKKKKKPKK